MPHDTPTGFPGVIIRMRSEKESAYFPTLALEALAKINSKPVGKIMLEQIVAREHKKKFGYTVCIMRPAGLGIVDDKQTDQKKWNGGSMAKRINENDACDSSIGTPTQVLWNANIIETPDGSRPSFISLAHELVHALYNLRGEAFKDTSAEEYRTVGLAPVANARFVTENKIRAEHNLPRRDSYSGLAPPTV